MTPFTNDDLKRLKAKANDPHGDDMFAVDVLSLLARLEAAEKVINTHEKWCDKSCLEIAEWRKTAGK